MNKTTSLSDSITTLLGIECPIIQAPMTWLTSAELVAAVSKAGGLGVLGPNAGQTQFAANGADAAEKMRQQINKIRQITDKPFGINFILPLIGHESGLNYAQALLRVILAEKVTIVVAVSYGEQSDKSYLNVLKQAGIKILYRDISPTVSRALAAQELDVDALIITGHEAGGHLSQHKISTLVLLPQVIEAVNIPVIAAGGIYDAITAKAVFVMGAAAIFMGTRFINTNECPAALSCKEAIIAANSEDLVVITENFGSIRLIARPNSKDKTAMTTRDYLHALEESFLFFLAIYLYLYNKKETIGKSASAQSSVSNSSASNHLISLCSKHLGVSLAR